jgi:hypothetical protein
MAINLPYSTLNIPLLDLPSTWHYSVLKKSSFPVTLLQRSFMTHQLIFSVRSTLSAIAHHCSSLPLPRTTQIQKSSYTASIKKRQALTHFEHMTNLLLQSTTLYEQKLPHPYYQTRQTTESTLQNGTDWHPRKLQR